MTLDVTQSVRERYSEGAESRQAELCCPVDYDRSLLAILPSEIIEKDYGCGDPSRYVESGDVVVDLGSGGGKICYIAAQLVGEQGKVIGVDMNDDMLDLARRHQADMASKIGSDRVSFVKGKIQDLGLSIDAQEAYLSEHPIQSQTDLEAFSQWQQQQRQTTPLIADSSVDLVISNCVLNLVDEQDRAAMLKDIFRVLKPGGRVAISDIICDQLVPTHLKNDAELWSGCISGAFETEQFIQAFKAAGFHGVRYDKWDDQPWQVVEEIEFRSATLTASKPNTISDTQCEYSVIYRGPFEQVTDDMGVEYIRGRQTSVSQAVFECLSTSSMASDFILPNTAQAVATGGCCAPSSQSCC